MIPGKDHEHYLNILTSKEGHDAYFDNKLPSIIGEYVDGDLNKNEVKAKIDELISITNEKYKNVNENRRIIRELEALSNKVEITPNNSTAGYIQMLEKFANVYIYKIATQENNSETVEKYTQVFEFVNGVNDKLLTTYGFDKNDLIVTLKKNSKNLNQIMAIQHAVKEVKKANGRPAEFKYSYANYFIEHLESSKISNELREELAFLTLKTDNIGISAIKPLMKRFIAAKNNLYTELNDSVDYTVVYGENYNKLKPVLNRVLGNVKYYKKYFEPLEFTDNITKETASNTSVSSKIDSESSGENQGDTKEKESESTPQNDNVLEQGKVAEQVTKLMITINDYKKSGKIDATVATELIQQARVIRGTVTKTKDLNQEQLTAAVSTIKMIQDLFETALKEKQ